ncbi:SMC-Scp complex subunit ScpB [Eubacterium sp. An3]|uniref:SMC-Scp complex subunit ScpB n=1 Tax=Eubacterium sp. An3 TaxID=1965628 RepID=UPI000B3930D6|nr:SMC-Scp complex subunit ScpB [Eubacterium sp. An3]OUO27755.1 SMC-Scp complex subunit ScpB [Eubacterium sp. An3]
MEDKKKIKGIIEAILFTMGRAVPLEQLTAVLEMDRESLRELLLEMKEEYNKEEARGICLIELDDSWQICTKIETYDYVRKLVSQPKKRSLTDVMLETLSIIAYKQPVTKQEIEAIRGVKCDFAVNKLVEYKLVKELGRLDTIGKPIVFGTTEEFLRCFGVSSIEELPDIDEVTKQSFMEEAMEEVAESLNVPV